MTLIQTRFLEKFVLVTFPIALAVGCTNSENPPARDELLGSAPVQRQIPVNPPESTKYSASQGDAMQLGHSMLQTAILRQPNIKLQNGTMPQRKIIYFAQSNYEVADKDVEILLQHADFLRQNETVILYVDGFADNRGSAAVNHKLSKKRAQQVADMLISLGAPETRIKVNGYGESFPLTSETNWDENRRVELEYSSPGASGFYTALK